MRLLSIRDQCKRTTDCNPSIQNSSSPLSLNLLSMPDSNENVEVAVQGAKEAYASQVTPSSSPRSSRATVAEIFQDSVSDLEEDDERRLHIQLVESKLTYVVEICESNAKELDLPPPTPYVPDDLPIHKPHAYPCRSTNDPSTAPPSKWPQAPLMLRPTPKSNTKIRGIRYSSSKEYRDYAGFCAGCILPINTGAEAPGKSLVVDFESKYFVGTLLMRIQQAPPAEPANQTSTSYFDGKKRRFQAIVKGRFKQEMSMSQCVTGQMFDRPTGKLPAKWIVSSAVRFLSTLAPQLEATIDGREPRFLAPLAATAHSVLQHPIEEEKEVYCSTCSEEEKDHLLNYKLYQGAQDLEVAVEEPPANSEQSILPEVPDFAVPNNATSSITSRQKARKKCLNTVSSKKMKDPKFSTQKEYCFEFYQHLLEFGDELAINMGRPIGQIGLAQPLNGQPLKCMSAFKDGDSLEPLWSFDIWHASLYPFAQAYYNQNQ